MGSTSGFKKFRLLLWKNFLLQKRHLIQTILEVTLPLVFIAVLVGTRSIINPDNYNEGAEFRPWSPTDLNGTVIQKNVEDNINTGGAIGPMRIYYGPANTMTKKIMEKVIEKFFTIPILIENNTYTMTFELVPFPNEQLLLAYYKEEMKPSILQVYGAVIFEELNEQFHYKLRFPAKQQRVENSSVGDDDGWYTNLLFPVYQSHGPRAGGDVFGGRPGYHSQGFTHLQYALDLCIMNYFNSSLQINNGTIEGFNVNLQRFPYPPYTYDRFIFALQQWLPLIFMLSFIYPVINITKSVVVEKERRLKESMKLMGLDNYLHWSAWFLKSFLFLLVSTICMAVLMKVKWYGNDLAVLTYADGTIIFVFLLSFVFSTIMLGFLVSTFCSKANSAATAAGVVWFVTYFPYFFLEPRYDQLGQWTKIVMSLLSNTAMAFGCQIISMFEGIGAGIQWDNVGSGVSPQDDLALIHCIVMMFADGILYFLIAIYVEAVFPGEFGVPQVWYFPFTKSYWFDMTLDNEMGHQNGGGATNNNIYDKGNDVDFGNFEPSPKNGKAGIRIRGLTKIFGKDNVAVNNLNLEMYEDQITALLGHNGAGKTTTMSMLTGFIVPTSGTAIINNLDIRKNIRDVRDSLGLCPQHDVLFDELTVEEHLRFFCLVKGYPHVDAEIDRMLAAVGLEPKRHAQAKTLSGGMKRKLSVAIALVGGSKVVLLDEPTSGMDPGARRATWDLLTSEKKHRTLLLSTHFMDECEVLGDRIAIMADGQLQTVGSSLFLKKRYGGGYHLIIVKQDGCDVSKITAIIRKHLGEATVEQDVGAELSYSLADKKAALFGDLFEELETKRKELKIDSYGASVTTMEEVFMRVGKEAEARKYGQSVVEEEKRNVSMETLQSSSLYNLHDMNKERNVGFSLFSQQLRAMIVKKALYSMRNRILLFVQTIVPVVFLIIALIMLNTLPDLVEPPELTIRGDHYGDTVVTLSCNDTVEGGTGVINGGICGSYGTFAIEQDKAEIEMVSNLSDFIKEKSKNDLLQVRNHYIVGMEKRTNNEITAFFNNQPYHGPAITMNYLTNALFKTFHRNSSSITATNFPLPFTTTDEVSNAGRIGSEGFQIGFNIAFGISFLASGFVVFLIKERESKSKHLQFVSGVKFWVFWLANFAFDMVNFVVPCILLIVVLIGFQAESFTNATVLACLFLLMLLYGWAIIPMMYLFSFWFTIPSSGFTRMWFFNVVTGLAPIVAVSIMQIPELELLATADTLDWIFMMFPNYSLGWAIVTLNKNYMLKQVCPLFFVISGFLDCQVEVDNPCCKEFNYGYLDWHPAGIGRYLVFLLAVGFLCFTILIVKESEIISKIFLGGRKKEHGVMDEFGDPMEDSDVGAEARRIRNTNLSQLFKTDNLVLRDVSKVYGTFEAVKCLNLGVQQKECFGLLGVNGAGKTTTFKMLTGDLPVTSGDAFVYGHSINSDIKNVQKNLGYCPQFDAVIEEMTGRETIRLFARLRGVRENEIDDLVNRLGSNLLFNEHMEKRVGQYSGGNKRKLSTALALVGNPAIVFLDEPTTGMDPVARRHLWNCISNIRRAGTSIVLTSHSMEECEALCNRLAIMVNGEFKCLGSPQHLKSKFGEGYTVIAQMTSKVEVTKRSFQESQIRRRKSSGMKEDWEREIEPLQNFIEDAFPDCKLKDHHPGYVHYHVTNTKLTWGSLFRKMEVAKDKFGLEAYSVGQTSLEQIFLNFTKTQVTTE